MRLTASENREYEMLIRDGWTIYKNGWPDFLAEKDGKFRLIEVKFGHDRLSANQLKMCKALFRFTGVRVEIKQYEKRRQRISEEERRRAKVKNVYKWIRENKPK